MRTKWTVLLWMLMISGLLAAQNTANTSFHVKGILLDSLTQEGEPYATIKIVKKEAPAKALKMLVTDMKGQFQEKVPGTGNFVMTVSAQIGNSSGAANSVTCDLLDANNPVATSITALPSTNTFQDTISLTGASDGGVVRLRCSPDLGASVRNLSLTAIRVGSVSSLESTP